MSFFTKLYNMFFSKSNKNQLEAGEEKENLVIPVEENTKLYQDTMELIKSHDVTTRDTIILETLRVLINSFNEFKTEIKKDIHSQHLVAKKQNLIIAQLVNEVGKLQQDVEYISTAIQEAQKLDAEEFGDETMDALLDNAQDDDDMEEEKVEYKGTKKFGLN